MKTNLSHFRPIIAALAAIIVLASTALASPAVTTQLEPAQIALGQSAQLIITVSGGDDAVSPPAVPGLEFVSAGQSSQFQSINGVTSSSVSTTYEVIPQRAGTFTIPALGPGSQPLALQVGAGAAAGNNPGASTLPPPATSGLSSGETHPAQDGSAFARLRLPHRALFVGESVPVEIQVGVRPGLVASLDGLPTLNGDDFTLNKLPAKPEQTQEIIEGIPYTVLTWHSILAAVKAGDFSLSVETPLTVRMRTAPQRPRMPGGFFDDAFDDPFFQSFF
ncbi:MAG TPA: BatD family protein, partial [Candidatus Saccharimonadales bacterium]|nr:BatD family protein [Candidatus Saccharimonadales bacterium]